MDDGKPARQTGDMAKRQDRAEKLRQKHPDTTGVYRRPGAGETEPHPTIWYMLDLAEERAIKAMEDPDASAEAKRNALETVERVLELRHLLAPPKADGQLTNWAHAVKLASVAMAAGMMAERLFVRSHEDDALHGIEVKTADLRITPEG